MLTQACVYPHLILRVGVGDFECGHGSCHGLHGGEDVLVNALGEALPVLLGEASAVDDPHLTDEGGLATLTGSYMRQQMGVVRIPKNKKNRRSRTNWN